MLVALLAALFVCLKAANVTSMRTEPTYKVYATFDNIGGLKVRSPVRIGGVVVGRVEDISLDPKTYLPRVTLDIEERYNHIPDTSSLSIRTSGLLGEQYLALNAVLKILSWERLSSKMGVRFRTPSLQWCWKI